MKAFSDICKAYTALSDNDIAILQEVRRSLAYTADLTSSDVFLDCYSKSGESAVVVWHSRPRWTASLYKGDVVGQLALSANEPAVYHALERGVPMHDTKAVTQEGRTVRQDALPVQNNQGQTIAVIIREKDISERIVKEKKFSFLVAERNKAANAPFTPTEDASQVALRESNHRIKNNLQLAASMMRMQSRNSPSIDVKEALEVNIQRVLTIASIHDILTNTGVAGTTELQALLNRVTQEIICLSQGSHPISIQVGGDSVYVPADTATAAAIVVNELITNAMMHGYNGGEQGNIKVNIQKGNLTATISVEDDGKGFDTQQAISGNGLAIVRLMVKDKLGGIFKIKSDANGTKAVFDIILAN